MIAGIRWCALVFASVATVAACGSGSDADAVAAALASDLQTASGFSEKISPAEADCVGGFLVERLGVEDARSIGVPDDDDDDPELELGALDEREIGALGDAMDRCVSDLEDLAVEVLTSGILERRDDTLEVTAGEAECIGQAVAAEVAYGRLLEIGLSSTGGAVEPSDVLTEDEAAVFARSFTGCIDVRATVLDMVRARDADPETVGCIDANITDEDLERLYVAAYSGDDDAVADAFDHAKQACVPGGTG